MFLFGVLTKSLPAATASMAPAVENIPARSEGDVAATPKSFLRDSTNSCAGVSSPREFSRPRKRAL